MNESVTESTSSAAAAESAQSPDRGRRRRRRSRGRGGRRQRLRPLLRRSPATGPRGAGDERSGSSGRHHLGLEDAEGMDGLELSAAGYGAASPPPAPTRTSSSSRRTRTRAYSVGGDQRRRRRLPHQAVRHRRASRCASRSRGACSCFTATLRARNKVHPLRQRARTARHAPDGLPLLEAANASPLSEDLEGAHGARGPLRAPLLRRAVRRRQLQGVQRLLRPSRR